jgi:hypothetical protein
MDSQDLVSHEWLRLSCDGHRLGPLEVDVPLHEAGRGITAQERTRHRVGLECLDRAGEVPNDQHGWRLHLVQALHNHRTGVEANTDSQGLARRVPSAPLLLSQPLLQPPCGAYRPPGVILQG